ncbi:hypothetical protein H6P81_015674 [Aristolochia fimbriata]|uniref:PAZ domain-containing protein n=1 Tax=Aristolochia fimbriata TaxID=158543 RepID=A0AAV7E6E4_ARIFI|nr:hypothetical protein H6P81_015674 [Aristolochia fimbriata]
MDYTVSPFRECLAESVIGFLEEKLGISFDDQTKSLTPIERRNIERELKQLKVTITYKKTCQMFMIMGLQEPSMKDEFFFIENLNHHDAKEIEVMEYLREKYGKEIIYKNLPCIDLSKKAKKKKIIDRTYSGISATEISTSGISTTGISPTSYLIFDLWLSCKRGWTEHQRRPQLQKRPPATEEGPAAPEEAPAAKEVPTVAEEALAAEDAIAAEDTLAAEDALAPKEAPAAVESAAAVEVPVAEQPSPHHH